MQKHHVDRKIPMADLTSGRKEQVLLYVLNYSLPQIRISTHWCCHFYPIIIMQESNFIQILLLLRLHELPPE